VFDRLGPMGEPVAQMEPRSPRVHQGWRINDHTIGVEGSYEPGDLIELGNGFIIEIGQGWARGLYVLPRVCEPELCKSPALKASWR